MNEILLRIQITIYVSTIFLIFIPVDTIKIGIIQLAFIGTGLVIKFFRQILRGNGRQMISAQVGFYIPYLLTGIQICFINQTIAELSDFKTETYISIVGLILLTVNYSLLTKKQLLSQAELVIYSLGIILQVLKQVNSTIFTIQFFDLIYDNEYIKDFLLLQTATAISVGALMLDMIYRTHQNKNKDK